MAMRGGPARRLVGNPLGGMLRDLDRQARSTTRRRRTPVPGQGDAVASLVGGVRRGVVRTGEDGRARWSYGAPYAGVPVLTALPVGSRPVVCVAEEVTPTYAVVRAWSPRGEPVGGVEVHLTARPA